MITASIDDYDGEGNEIACEFRRQTNSEGTIEHSRTFTELVPIRAWTTDEHGHITDISVRSIPDRTMARLQERAGNELED